MDGDTIRAGIRANYELLQDNINYNELAASLFTADALSLREKQDLEALQLGSISKAAKLLDIVLGSEEKAKKFFELLQQDAPDLASLIECEKPVVLKEEESEIQQFIAKLKEIYKGKLGIVTQIPGERFLLDLSNDKLIMPLVVTAEKIDRKQHQMMKKRMKGAKPKYNKIQLNSVDEVFTFGPLHSLEDLEVALDVNVPVDEANEEIPPSFYLCLGIAGTGKTVMLQRFAYEWAMKKNSFIEHFYVILYIPLRKINLRNSIVDILGTGKNCLGYASTEAEKQLLLKYLCRESNAKHVLFAIDGLDEVDLPIDCELYSLLQGDLYHGSNIFITSRPDIEALDKIRMFTPDVKLFLKGTNKEGIISYIVESLVHEDGPSEEVALQLIEKCQTNLFNFDVLHVPLYLTLITVIFHEHFAQNASFTHFQVPQTMTQLFNAFVSVLINIWIYRLGNVELASQGNSQQFEQCPLGVNSRLPAGIQGKVFLIGRMSFELLLQKCYEFTNKNLAEYLIDKNDISLSGMFCIDTNINENNSIYYFRHKTLQEYFAALYLVSTKCKEHYFLEHIREKQSNNTKLTIDELFSPLQLCIQFLFGLNPDIACSFFNDMKLSMAIGVNKTSSEYCIDLLRFAELSFECCNKDFSNQLENSLLELDLMEEQFDVYKQYANYCVYVKYFQSASHEFAISFLKKVYHIEVTHGNSKDCSIRMAHAAELTSSDRLDLSILDIICAALLSKYRFPKVKFLFIEKSMITNVELLHQIFPSVKNVTVRGYVHYDNLQGFTPEENSQTSLTEVSLENTYSRFSRSLPCEDLKSLAHQNNLENLNIFRFNIFSHANIIREHKWLKLTSLTVHMDMFNKSIEQVILLLATCSSLITLHFAELSESLYETNKDAKMLFETLQCNCKQLKTVTLLNLFNRRWLWILNLYLPLMKLNHLGFSEKDFAQITEETIAVLLKGSKLTIDVHCSKNSKVKFPETVNQLHDSSKIVVSYLFDE